MATNGAVLDVNVDMGESYGRWRLGDDAGMMPHITSVNVACGYHAGDPSTLRETVGLAVDLVDQFDDPVGVTPGGRGK